MGHSLSEHVFFIGQALPGCSGNVKMSKIWLSSQKTKTLVGEIATLVSTVIGVKYSQRKRTSPRIEELEKLPQV